MSVSRQFILPEPYGVDRQASNSKVSSMLRLREVEALVVVVDSDEFLDKGLPFDRLDRIHTSGSVAEGRGPELLKLLSLHI